ncbi:MAG: DUF493 domain-containing protein [Gammaproteobacteria bacterium]|nr:DUF493 domain-containing protein [Gammaproteobacteria bacterium]
MQNQDPPRITFPCDYAIKVIGDAAPDFKEFVLSVVSRHAPGLDETLVTLQASSNARFVSVRLQILATGEPQLKAIFEELRASGRVHMVL